MHYKNGREAKVGDSVVGTDWNGFPVSGVVVRTTESEGCNIYVMPTGNQGVPVYTAGEFILRPNPTSNRMAATCYICGARTRNKANLTCGFDACKAEHVRRHPEAAKKKSYLFNPPPTHKRNRLYDDKLQPQ